MEYKNIFKALAEFQYEIPIIYKGTQGYGYSYTDLPRIVEVITPYLEKHDLGYTQFGKGDSIVTRIFHWPSGEYMDSEFNMKQDVTLAKMNDYQVAGSAITYYRRYGLSSALGLVTEKDTDGSGEQVKVKSEDKQPEPEKAPQVAAKPEFGKAAFNKHKNVVQKYLNDGLTHEQTINKIKANFSVVTDEAKKLIKSVKKQSNAVT